MFAIRLALLLSVLYGYHVIAFEGPGICPHGGHGMSTTSDQGGGTDPDGRTHAASTGDAGVRIDPEG
ncbi:MAG TPA: hypothetical protein VHY33_03575 [Thermoanaerobaculia bacterium]|jgi:hypothetical protein|nr:hypothetical protein [Thermoanaerobaculia bacterium]